MEKLEEITGMEIRYSSIRPAFFSSLDIRNLKFLSDGDEVLTISRARFYFSLFELIFKRKIVFNTIQIDYPLLRLDLEKNRAALEIFKKFSDNSNSGKDALTGISAFLPEKADYRIRGGLFNVSSGSFVFQVENVNVNVKGGKDGLSLGAKLDAEFTYTGAFDRTIVLGAKMGLEGDYSLSLGRLASEISFSNLGCWERNARAAVSFLRQSTRKGAERKLLFRLSPFSLGLSYKDRIVEINESGKNARYSYNLRFDTASGEILAGVNLNDFNLASFINFSENLKTAEFILNRETSGGLSLQYKKDDSFNYSVFLQSGNISRSYSGDELVSNAFLLNAYGDKEKVLINDLFLNAASGSGDGVSFQGIVSFTGSVGFFPLRPRGIVNVERFTLTGKESVNGVFNISSGEKDIHVSGVNIALGSYSIENFDMFFYPSARDIAVTLSSNSRDNASLYFDAVFYRSQRQLEASMSLAAFSVLNLTEIFRPFVSYVSVPAAFYLNARNTLIDADFFFSSNLNKIAYNAPRIVIRKEKNIGVLSLSGTENYFALNNCVFYLGEDELVFSAYADYSSAKDIDFTLNADYIDVSWNITGQILDKTTLIIHDPLGLHAYGSVSNTGAVSGYIEGVDFPVPASLGPAYIDFYVALRYNTKEFWNVDISRLKFQNPRSRFGAVNFAASGSADQDGANIKNISYSDNIGALAGGASFAWKHDFSDFNFMFSMADGREGKEKFSLEGKTDGGKYYMDAAFSNARLDRFIRSNQAITASASAALFWESIDSFNVNVNLSSFETRTRKSAIRASLELLLTNNDLIARNVRFDYSDVKFTFPVFQILAAEGTGKISADFNGNAANRKVNGKMDISANFAKINSWLEIKKALNNIDGTARIENLIFGNTRHDMALFSFSGNEEAFSFLGGINNMIRLEFDRKGNFFASLSSPLPIRGSLAGIFNRGNIDAYCNDFYVDMESLWSLAANPIDDFNIAGGYITGKMSFRGPFWNPEFFGSGTATSLRLQVPNFISEDIRPVPFQIKAEGYEMTFGPVATVSGKGGGTVDGWFRYEYWVPRNIGLNINIPRESPIPYNINVSGFLANGNASGKLNLNLNSDEKLMEIVSALFMNNAEMGFMMEDAASKAERQDREKYNIVVDLSITSGSMVEFLWPSVSSPILRAAPEMGTVFHIASDSQSEQYSLVSDVKIRSGELYYLDRNFYIRQGSLVFRENETRFNPMITARAEIRDRSNTGPVTISMIIENQPLLSFVPRFESTPGLTQLEIYSILGQNFHNAQNGDMDTGQRFLIASSTDVLAQLISGSDALPDILYLKRFERNVRRVLNLDMLSVRTRFLQNAVVTSSSTMIGVTPVDRIGRVGNYFDNTTVFIGKYVGQDMFIQGTMTLKYNENSVFMGGLRLEPDIGVELQNPFFNIRWSFFPYHPQNWWVNDNSFTLTWRRSF